MPREYYVYVLHCNDGSYYTGVTNDYESRLNDHQQGIDTRSYTCKRRPVRLVYLATFGDIHEAIDWEKRVKRWSRKKKEALMRGDFEGLPALAKCQNITALFRHQPFKHLRYSTKRRISVTLRQSSG